MLNEKLVELVSVIFDKTKESSLNWEVDAWNDGYSVNFSRYRINVDSSGLDYKLILYNENGEIVESVYDSQLLSTYHFSESPLQTIYYLARRKALRTDDVINDILGELRKPSK